MPDKNRQDKSVILAIADDLTGALEVGACFRGAIVTTQLLSGNLLKAPVLVVDTETRHLPPEQAAEVVYRTVTSTLRANPCLVYKKTDSTLRGNIAAEFRSLLKAMPGHSLVYSPAYPKLGRVVKSGELFVHGIRVHETEFAADTLNPVRSSNIAEMLEGIPASIVDGESDAHLKAAAGQITRQNPRPIVAGPAGFAAALAECLQAGNRQLPALPSVSRCLVVNGSTHPVSSSQIEFARTRGFFSDGWILFEDAFDEAGVARAERTGEQIRRILETSKFDALVVFGGDTAFGIHRALGFNDFHSLGEVVPGVPMSRSGDLLWITKAGGFGAPDALCEIRERLT